MDLLYINNQRLDIESEQNFKIVIAVNDIASLDKRNDSYTEKIKVPKTQHNINVMQGLSLRGDMSRMPYKKNNCVFIRDGVPLIRRGWAIIDETKDEYHIHIYEGIVDLYKAMDNLTIGSDLELSEINHTKNVSAVINSFTNENYRYLIADYNGQTHYNNSILIDYLVPSVRIKYLWEKIQQKIGWKFEGDVFNTEEFNNLWLTYPRPTVNETETKFEVLTASKLYTSKFYGSIGSIPAEDMPEDSYYKKWDNNLDIKSDEAELLSDGWSIQAKHSGKFSVTVTLQGHTSHTVESRKSFVGAGENPYKKTIVSDQIIVEVWVNGALTRVNFEGKSKGGISGIVDEEVQSTEFLPDISKGDIITFKIRPKSGGKGKVEGGNPTVGKSKFRGTSLVIKKLDVSIQRLNAGNADFNEALSEFKMLDFFREILWHFGLTIFVDKYEEKAYFLTMNERFQKANIYDFSEYYIDRTSEKYQISTYAQKNRFKYKYNDEESTYNDGILKIDDINLDDEKNVIESKIYTPDKDKVGFILHYSNISTVVNVFRIWNKEPNNNDGIMEIRYKGLDKRFYFARSNTVAVPSGASFVSQQLSEGPVSVNSLPLASYSGLTFREIVKNNYPDIVKILNDTRIHTIEMHLPLPLVSQFDMKGLYYFKQEAQYYIPNRLQYSQNKVTGDFIRVKHVPRFLDCPLITGLKYEISINPIGTQDIKFTWDLVTDTLVENIKFYKKEPGGNWQLDMLFPRSQIFFTLGNLKLGKYSFRFELVGKCENTLPIDLLPGFTEIGETNWTPNRCPLISGLKYENPNTGADSRSQTFKFTWDEIKDTKVKQIHIYVKKADESNWRLEWSANSSYTQALIRTHYGKHSFRFELVGDCENNVSMETLPGFDTIGYEKPEYVAKAEIQDNHMKIDILIPDDLKGKIKNMEYEITEFNYSIGGMSQNYLMERNYHVNDQLYETIELPKGDYNGKVTIIDESDRANEILPGSKFTFEWKVIKIYDNYNYPISGKISLFINIHDNPYVFRYNTIDFNMNINAPYGE